MKVILKYDENDGDALTKRYGAKAPRRTATEEAEARQQAKAAVDDMIEGIRHMNPDVYNELMSRMKDTRNTATPMRRIGERYTPERMQR